jgi:AraC family transcriptional regulator
MARLDLTSLPSSNDPTTVLAHSPSYASCLAVAVMAIPRQAELVEDFHPVPRLFVAHGGRGQRWYRQGARTTAMSTEPGMIELYEKGLGFDHCRWDGEPGHCVLVEFDDKDVEAVTHGELPRLRLRTKHELFDARVRDVVFGLAHEVLVGLPNGRLYAQGLSTSLLGLLNGNYAEHGSPEATSSAGQLGVLQRHRVIDLIDSQLGSDLSLTRLADEAGISPYRFGRAFKATFGVTPHSYVLDRRLESAMRALRSDPFRSIADIAIAFGFASQSHMTDLMKRKHGATPREIRAGR